MDKRNQGKKLSAPIFGFMNMLLGFCPSSLAASPTALRCWRSLRPEICSSLERAARLALRTGSVEQILLGAYPQLHFMAWKKPTLKHWRTLAFCPSSWAKNGRANLAFTDMPLDARQRNMLLEQELCQNNI
jgi:hypothetical protein